MIIQKIQSGKRIWNRLGTLSRDIPPRYAGRQGDRIVVDTSQERVIARLCAHLRVLSNLPESWLAKMGRPIQEFSDQELVDVIKKENA